MQARRACQLRVATRAWERALVCTHDGLASKTMGIKELPPSRQLHGPLLETLRVVPLELDHHVAARQVRVEQLETGTPTELESPVPNPNRLVRDAPLEASIHRRSNHNLYKTDDEGESGLE